MVYTIHKSDFYFQFRLGDAHYCINGIRNWRIIFLRYLALFTYQIRVGRPRALPNFRTSYMFHMFELRIWSWSSSKFLFLIGIFTKSINLLSWSSDAIVGKKCCNWHNLCGVLVVEGLWNHWVELIICPLCNNKIQMQLSIYSRANLHLKKKNGKWLRFHQFYKIKILWNDTPIKII